MPIIVLYISAIYVLEILFPPKDKLIIPLAVDKMTGYS